MIYAKGTALWHAVRALGEETITLCGRRLPAEVPIADRDPGEFLCQTCALAIARSPSVVGA